MVCLIGKLRIVDLKPAIIILQDVHKLRIEKRQEALVIGHKMRALNIVKSSTTI